MRLSEENELTLAKIETFNQGLAQALRNTCSAAETYGPSDAQTKEKDAQFKAGDAKVQERQHGKSGDVVIPKYTNENMLRIIGLSAAGFWRLAREYGAGAVEEQMQIAVKDVACGTKVNHAESFLLYRLKIDRDRG